MSNAMVEELRTGELADHIRDAGFVSQREFAEYIGWTEEHVSRVVRGKKQPSTLLKRYLATAIVLRRARAALQKDTDSNG